jgi:hypothetical protein
VRIAAGWSLDWRPAVASAIVLTAVALVGVLLPARSLECSFARLALSCWLLVPYGAGYLVSLVRPMYAERYLIVSSLPFILLVGRALTLLVVAAAQAAGDSRALRGQPAVRLSPWESPAVGRMRGTTSVLRPPIIVAAAIASVGIILALAVVPLDNVWIGLYQKSTYNTHMGDVDALYRPGDAVILDGASQLPLYSYYLRRPWPTFVLPSSLPLDPEKTSAELTDITRSHTGAWIFLYATPDYDPGYVVPRWLAQNAYRTYDNWQVTGRLQYYAFAPGASLLATATRVDFGGALELIEVESTTSSVTAGDSLPVRLRWTRPSVSSRPARVSLRLVDVNGDTWAQADKDVGGDFFQPSDWPNGQPFDDRHGLMVPPGTPPGDYRLLLNVYESGSPNPLPASGTGLKISPSGVILRSVQLTQPSDHLWTRGIGGYVPIGATFGSGIELEGFAGSPEVQAGGVASLSLYWKSLVDHPTATRLHADLVANSGSLVAQVDLPLATAAAPATSWTTGRVFREMYRIPVPAGLPPSDYHLRVQPLGDNQVSGPGPVGPSLATLSVLSGASLPPAVPPQHPLGDTLGTGIALAGFDLESDKIPPGGTLRLALHWTDVGPVDTDYTVFVHVLDANEKVVTQRDQQPAAGRRPTTSWTRGDQLVDSYSIDLPSTLSPGTFEIEIGMYNANTGARLPVTRDGQAAGDRIIISRIIVTS